MTKEELIQALVQARITEARLKKATKRRGVDVSKTLFYSFGYDPLLCPVCRHKMELLDIYYNHQRVFLEELYEKAMSKSRGMRSSA